MHARAVGRIICGDVEASKRTLVDADESDRLCLVDGGGEGTRRRGSLWWHLAGKSHCLALLTVDARGENSEYRLFVAYSEQDELQVAFAVARYVPLRVPSPFPPHQTHLPDKSSPSHPDPPNPPHHPPHSHKPCPRACAEVTLKQTPIDIII